MKAKAYILINVGAGKLKWKWIYNQLRKVKNIISIDPVTGSFDFIAVIEDENFNEVWQTVLDELQAIDGITGTVTCNVISIKL
ncbi:MAG: Lrp/AsnC ligand binding domain-containing protein [Candidatus Stahlbacteria bacterium]|nr:Lrp/AsnC ligand binding domain-containing protein [Candidatus Stahlbacteria bacterium]